MLWLDVADVMRIAGKMLVITNVMHLVIKIVIGLVLLVLVIVWGAQGHAISVAQVIAKVAHHAMDAQAVRVVAVAQVAPIHVGQTVQAAVDVQDVEELVQLVQVVPVVQAAQIHVQDVAEPVHLAALVVPQLAIVDARTDAKAVQQDADQAAPMGVRGVLAVLPLVLQLVKTPVKGVRDVHPLVHQVVIMVVLIPATILVQQIADRLVLHNVMETVKVQLRQ